MVSIIIPNPKQTIGAQYIATRGTEGCPCCCLAHPKYKEQLKHFPINSRTARTSRGSGSARCGPPCTWIEFAIEFGFHLGQITTAGGGRGSEAGPKRDTGFVQGRCCPGFALMELVLQSKNNGHRCEPAGRDGPSPSQEPTAGCGLQRGADEVNLVADRPLPDRAEQCGGHAGGDHLRREQPGDLNTRIGHNIGSQAPISIPHACPPRRARHTPREEWYRAQMSARDGPK